MDSVKLEVSEKMDKIVDAIQKKNALEKAFHTNRCQEMVNRLLMIRDRFSHVVADMENHLNYINEHTDVLAEFIGTRRPMSSLNMPYSQQRNFLAEMESCVNVCNTAGQTLSISNICPENINSECESTQKTDCQEESISGENDL